jgi:hemerythrin-like domain-containing protein
MTAHRLTRQTLHDEHRANLELLGRVEAAFGRATRAGAGYEVAVRQLAGALAQQVEQDVGRHFEFEERELFGRLAEAGDGDIAALLAEEHEAMRELADELLPLARACADGTLDDAGWALLRRLALEQIERQVSHIQKEEMALLPMLDDLLDDATDRELAMAYASA